VSTKFYLRIFARLGGCGFGGFSGLLLFTLTPFFAGLLVIFKFFNTFPEAADGLAVGTALYARFYGLTGVLAAT